MVKCIFSLWFAFSCLLHLHGQENRRVEISREIIHHGDTVYGTLLTKEKDLQNFNELPLIIIIPGSGPTDRDGNVFAGVNGKNDSYKQLADSLLKYDIATYRYDKPGIGQSGFTGTEDDLRFEDNITLVEAILAKFSETGFKNIYLLGHSEGSLISILAAQKNKKVRGLISLAGPGQNAGEIIKLQLKESPVLPDSVKKETFAKIDSLMAGNMIRQYNPIMGSLLRESVQPYLISWFRYTPAKEISKLRKPVLIIQGGRDMQVSEQESEILLKAARKASYLYYPKMNHVLKMVDESLPQNQASYTDPDFPLQNGIAEDISIWIRQNR